MMKSLATLTLFAILLTVAAVPAIADGGIVFTDQAAASGINFQRGTSPDRIASRQAILDSAPFDVPTFRANLAAYAMKAHGTPGVVLFDYDNDGDLDIYVTNGPGRDNRLYSNQLVESGAMSFLNLAVLSGTNLNDQDSSGACAGDIDNDGDQDLYVVSIGFPNHLLENNGDGTFTDISGNGTIGDNRHANGCTMLDANGDGLLDIFVANSYDDWNHRRSSNTPGPTYPGNEHNYLFMNLGGNMFADVSAAAGVESVSNMSGSGLSGAALTWATGAFDWDLDGDTDILCADNQGVGATAPEERRGWLRLYDNDGSGNFTEITEGSGLQFDGGWMGLAFGDYNCDGYIDFFGTNLGDYLTGAPAARSSFWYNNGDGTWTWAPSVESNSFGFGASPLDYDNDGDLDVVYHGGVDRMNFIGNDNPGVLSQNIGNCSGEFTHDISAFTVDHATRTVEGVAVGDLNNDGFPDIVTASGLNVLKDSFYVPIGFGSAGFPSPLDTLAFFTSVLQFDGTNFQPGNVNHLTVPGNVVVEINSADNGNRWAKVHAMGTIGITSDGVVNRDGVGAVVTFTNARNQKVARPVMAGSSYASQDEMTLGFGFGNTRRAIVDVLWPGGTRNRIYEVTPRDQILFPEIPCSYDGEFATIFDYALCTFSSLNEIQGAGAIDSELSARLFVGALRAYLDENFFKAN